MRAVRVLLALTTTSCSLIMDPGSIRDERAVAGVVDAGHDGDATTDAAPAALFAEGFEALTVRENWRDGTSEGSWTCEYSGGGPLGVELEGGGGGKVFSLAPSGSDASALVFTNRDDFGAIDVSIRMKTVAQLRTPSPAPNEAATLVWGYASSSAEGFFLTIGPSAWELTSRKGTAAPVVLATRGGGCEVGKWCTVHVRHVAGTARISIDAGAGVDVPAPSATGRIGLYADAAHAHFDDLVVRAP